MNKSLKNFFGVAVVVLAVVAFMPAAHAAVGVSVNDAVQIKTNSSPDGASFDVKVTNIAKAQEGVHSTQFFFEPTSLINSQNIAYWKIRVYCEDKVLVTVNGMPENSCGKAERVERTADDKFFVTLSNPSGDLTGFSFKLKAYNKAGDWLHTEKEAFRWK